jgi:CRISPR-associated protein Cmr4
MLSGASVLFLPIYSIIRVVGVEATTNIHVGSGSGLVADVGVQRDEFGFPCILSSSLKGSLKTALFYAFASIFAGGGGSSASDPMKLARYAVSLLLGSEPDEGETFESSVAVLDAYLLAMPVRSLKGVYTYITSSTLLARFKERLEMLRDFTNQKQISNSVNIDNAIKALDNVINVSKNIVDEALCIGDCNKVTIDAQSSVEVLKGRAVIAEEFIVKVSNIRNVLAENNNLSELENLLKMLIADDMPVLILSDDMAREVIDRGLIRVVRIRLSKESKTVDEGPWTEEYVPRKTVLHTLFLFKAPPIPHVRYAVSKAGLNISVEDINGYVNALKALKLIGDGVDTTASLLQLQETIAGKVAEEVVKKAIQNKLKNYIIVGGRETIGKGIVRLRII